MTRVVSSLAGTDGGSGGATTGGLRRMTASTPTQTTSSAMTTIALRRTSMADKLCSMQVVVNA
jgi:hypothetical protein